MRIVSPNCPINCCDVAPDAAASAILSKPPRAPLIMVPHAGVSLAFISGGMALTGVPRRPRALASATTRLVSPAARPVEIAWIEFRNRRIWPKMNVRSAGVRSGNTIVADTRIAVHDVVGLLQNGETVDTVKANCFPQLTKSQVYECLAYYEDHRGEIDLLIARQMSLASE